MSNQTHFSIKGTGLGITISIIMILIGFYFLPLGNDVTVWWIMDNLAGGDYWIAQRILYAITISLIVGGIILGFFLGVRYKITKNGLARNPSAGKTGYRK